MQVAWVELGIAGMTKFDYANARLVAKGLIDKFGQSGEFTVKGGGEGGYDRFGNPIPSEPDVVIDGTVTPLLQYKKHDVDNDRILATDSYVFFYSEETPPIDSQTTINGQTFIVKDVTKLSSVDDIDVYTKLQLRK